MGDIQEMKLEQLGSHLGKIIKLELLWPNIPKEISQLAED